MPITTGVTIQPVSQKEFHAIDYEIMEIIFSVHNDLGRFCNEVIYQRELEYRCNEMGFESVKREVPIHVSYKDFCKTYLIDLLINNSIPYETKAVVKLGSEHQKQLLNYLLLTRLSHGKLVNMGASSVEAQFVSTQLNPEKRYRYQIYDEGWVDDAAGCRLKSLILELVHDWGMFLDLSLFYDAVGYFLTDGAGLDEDVEIKEGARTVGRQKMNLIGDRMAFKMSAITKETNYYESHLRKFVAHTDLRQIQWVNFNHHNLEFRTIINK